MSYTQDEKSTGLDTLTTLAANDLIIVGDVSDSGRAKAITQADYIVDLEANLDLTNIGGTINLTTQVTGVLPLVNGGTASALSDPGANKLWGWDNTDNAIGFWTIGSGLVYDHLSHTISATSGGSGLLESFNDPSGVIPGFGVTTPVLVHTYTIPANTFSVGEVLRITNRNTTYASNANNVDTEVFIGGVSVKHYSQAGTGGGPLVTNSSVFIGIVKAATMELTDTTEQAIVNAVTIVTGATGENAQVNYAQTIAFDPTVSNTIEFYVTNNTGNGGASFQLNSLVIEKV